MEPMASRTSVASCKHCGLVPMASMSRHDTHVVCESGPMRDLFRRAARFASSDAPVVVLGESGTGKEVVARVLHANGPRAPLFTVARTAHPGYARTTAP